VQQRTAFSRAWANLGSHRMAQWSAWITSGLAAILTVVLLGVFALFVDLLVAQGKIPSEHELTPSQQAAFAAGLQGMSAEQRNEALENVGVPADRVPAFNAELAALTVVDREQLWRAYVWQILRTNVSTEAAARYAARARPTDPHYDVNNLGLLSLVVRTNGLRVQRMFAWLASWNTWSWRQDDARFPNFWYLTGLLFVAIIVAIARGILVNLMHLSAASAALAVGVWLRRAVYHHTYRLGALTIRATGPGEGVGIFTRHVENIQAAIRTKLTTQVFAPVELLCLLAFALCIHFWLGLAYVLAALLVLLWGGQIAMGLRRSARIADRRAAARMSLLQESMMMMRLVKSNVMELFNQSRVERQLADYESARLQRTRNEAFVRPLLWFLGALAAAVMLYVSGIVVLSGGLSASNVVVLVVTLWVGYWPLRDWLRHGRRIRRGQESAVHVYEFLDRPREVAQVIDAQFLPAVAKGVEFREVGLRDASSGRVLLDGVSLKISAGERVGIVGPDEAEKHALVYLLSRFLDPTSGEIRIDDKNLKWLTLDSIRTQIGVVLQPNLIFNDTVGNNIGCGDPMYTIPQIIEAAKVAHAHQFIQKLPYGYETPIGELGSSLRPSEQFRIALARAVLRDPAMYVIEEPRSPLDDDAKNLLDDTFSRVLPGKTVLFLPHRISTIRSCDRVYLINQGQVEAVGVHRDLVAQSDLYKHLHYMEFNEFAEHN